MYKREALGQENQALNQLSIADSEFRQDAAKTVGEDLWNLGLQKRGNEDRRDQWKREGLTAAAALENAATYNKQNAYNKILGGISAGVGGIARGVEAKDNNAQWMDFLKEYYMKNGSLPTQQAASIGG